MCQTRAYFSRVPTRRGCSPQPTGIGRDDAARTPLHTQHESGASLALPPCPFRLAFQPAETRRRESPCVRHDGQVHTGTISVPAAHCGFFLSFWPLQTLLDPTPAACPFWFSSFLFLIVGFSTYSQPIPGLWFVLFRFRLRFRFTTPL